MAVMLVMRRYLFIVYPSSIENNKKSRGFPAASKQKSRGPFSGLPAAQFLRSSCHERLRQTSPKKPKKLKKPRLLPLPHDMSDVLPPMKWVHS